MRLKVACGEQVARDGVGVGFRESRVAGVGGTKQPVEIVVSIGPVLHRADAVDRQDAAGRVAGVAVVDDLGAGGPCGDDPRQPAAGRRIGEGGIDAVRIVDAPGLAVGLILDRGDGARDRIKVAVDRVGRDAGAGEATEGQAVHSHPRYDPTEQALAKRALALNMYVCRMGCTVSSI